MTTDPTPIGCQPQPKWFAAVNDVPIATPQRVVPVRLIKFQGRIGDDQVLVRDHGSPQDGTLVDDQEIDLAFGNVFYTVEKADHHGHQHCDAPAKLAFLVDDRIEETTRQDQTRLSLLELFGLAQDTTVLYRDRESPSDDLIEGDGPINFDDGPVFVTKRSDHRTEVEITINGPAYHVPKGTYSVEQIKTIPQPRIPAEHTLSIVIGQEIKPLANDASVKIHGGEVFVSNQPSGGAS